MSQIASLYATFADEAEARRIGRLLIEERLASCVNVLGPCHSIYRWQGNIEETAEIAAIFKVSEDQAEAAIRRIGELHSYDVPAVAVWRIEQTSEAYRRWVVENSSGNIIPSAK